MTRDDRELAIADNIDYVGRVLEQIRVEYDTRPPLVFSGFSQGGAMAYRAAAAAPAAGVIVLAADVPPDVATGARLPPVLIGRGTGDPFYTEPKAVADIEALTRMGATFEMCVFDGAHEWSDPFREAAARFLRRVS
jgi:predicted esterase